MRKQPDGKLTIGMVKLTKLSDAEAKAHQNQKTKMLSDADIDEIVNRARADARWVDALDQLEQHRNKNPLCDLFASDCETSKYVRECLVDLIERRFPPAPRGRKRTPIYMISKTEWFWWMACSDVQDYILQGESKDAALDMVAKKIGRTKAQLKSKLDHDGFGRSINHSVDLYRQGYRAPNIAQKARA